MSQQIVTSGEAIRALRSLAGLTLKQVAEGADTSFSYLSKVERNEFIPTQDYIAKVTAFLASAMLKGSKRSDGNVAEAGVR